MIKYYALTKHSQIKDILFDIIDTPISPELSDKNQKQRTLLENMKLMIIFYIGF